MVSIRFPATVADGAGLLKSKLPSLFQLYFETYMVSPLLFQLVTRNIRKKSSPGDFFIVEIVSMGLPHTVAETAENLCDAYYQICPFCC